MLHERSVRVESLRKGIIPLAIVAILIIAVTFFSIGRLTSSLASTSPATPTATLVIPTATPNLVLRSPHVLATFLEPNAAFAGPCVTCDMVTFTANGPFDMIASCNPFNVGGGATLSYQLQLFNGNGHLLDTLQEQCGDPSQDTSATVVIPESVAAGSYQLQVNPNLSTPISVVILDASS